MLLNKFISRKSIILLLFFTSIMNNANAEITLGDIQHDWAIANYETPKKDQKEAFDILVKKSRDLLEIQSGSAEPRVWLAIVLSTQAGVIGGLGALGKVKEARKLLDEAEAIDANVLNGSIYTSLGSLYYQVPGWPVGFGKHSKAEKYLKKALSINPDGIDPNYFYGDFMLEEKEFKKAVVYLTKAQAAAPRPHRPVADKGRQKEIAEKLAIANSKL